MDEQQFKAIIEKAMTELQDSYYEKTKPGTYDTVAKILENFKNRQEIDKYLNKITGDVKQNNEWNMLAHVLRSLLYAEPVKVEVGDTVYLGKGYKIPAKVLKVEVGKSPFTGQEGYARMLIKPLEGRNKEIYWMCARDGFKFEHEVERLEQMTIFDVVGE